MICELFSTDPRVGPTHPTRGSGTSNTSRSLTPRISLVRTHNIVLLLWHRIHKLQHRKIHIHTHARIHPYPLQTGHRSLRGIVFEVSHHGLDPRVEPAGQDKWSCVSKGDPTRMKLVPHGSIGRCRVGSGRVRRF